MDKILALGRPGPVSVESFSPPTINSQLLRPLSATNSILDPVDSPWPGLASTPSPAWNVSMASSLCNDELTNIPVSLQLSNTTKVPTTVKQSLPNSYFPPRVSNSRPIGADVLLSSSSSVASEIQEQMSQSVRQKQFLGSQIFLPERSQASSSIALERTTPITRESLSLTYSTSDSMSIPHPMTTFKPHGHSAKSSFIQSQSQLAIDKDIVQRVQHIEQSSNSSSGIKTVPIHPSYDLKVLESNTPPANHLISPNPQIREQDILKEVDSINRRSKYILGIPSAIKTSPRIENQFVSTLEQPLLPVNVIPAANFNNGNNAGVLESVRIATNPGAPFSFSTPRTGTINVVNTVPITQDTSLTIFPAVNTPKMSLITLDNTSKVLPETEISINRSRPPLRRSLKPNSMESMIISELQESTPLQNQGTGGKVRPLQNIEIVQAPILNPEENLSLIIPNQLSHINPKQPSSNIKFVPCESEFKAKQSTSSEGESSLKLWPVGSSSGYVRLDNDRNIITAQKLSNCPLVSNDMNLEPQRIQSIITRSDPDIKSPNLNFPAELNVFQKPSSSSTYLLDPISPTRAFQNNKASNDSNLIPVSHVHIVPQATDSIKTGLYPTTVLNSDNLTKKLRAHTDGTAPISVISQNRVCDIAHQLLPNRYLRFYFDISH